MNKYIKMFENFIPKESDNVDDWDIPTSKNCAIKTICFMDDENNSLVYSQDESRGHLVGDVYYTNNDNNGYSFDLHRQWIDENLGNHLMNYLQKNHSEYNFPLDQVICIEVTLLPQGGKKTFKLIYNYDGRIYKLTNKRYLPLN